MSSDAIVQFCLSSQDPANPVGSPVVSFYVRYECRPETFIEEMLAYIQGVCEGFSTEFHGRLNWDFAASHIVANFMSSRVKRTNSGAVAFISEEFINNPKYVVYKYQFTPVSELYANRLTPAAQAINVMAKYNGKKEEIFNGLISEFVSNKPNILKPEEE